GSGTARRRRSTRTSAATSSRPASRTGAGSRSWSRAGEANDTDPGGHDRVRGGAGADPGHAVALGGGRVPADRGAGGRVARRGGGRAPRVPGADGRRRRDARTVRHTHVRGRGSEELTWR